MFAYLIGNILILFVYFKNFKDEAYNFKNILLLSIILFFHTNQFMQMFLKMEFFFLLIFFFTIEKFTHYFSTFLGLSLRWGFILYFCYLLIKII